MIKFLFPENKSPIFTLAYLCIFMDRFLRIITPDVKSLVENKRTSEAIYALEETISWSLVQLALIWGHNFTNLLKAEEALRAAIKLVPGSWEFHINLSHILNLATRFEEAKEEALRAVELAHGANYEPYYNLGVILVNLGDHEAAVAAYSNALHRTSNKYCLAAYNIATSLLALGKWKEGWDAYENRFFVFEKLKNIHDRFKIHYEKDMPCKGKNVYVYSEQGIGDMIQFARYLPNFKKLTGAAKLILEPQINITKLMEDNFKLECVPRIDGEWPAIPEDIHCAVSINSLAGLFKAGIKEVPIKPYIKAPTREMPDLLKCNKMKVGICWAGNPDHVNDIKRSIYLKNFAPLFHLENVQLYSLQKNFGGTRNWWGKHVDLLSNLPANNITDLSPDLNDFSDTAYYISQMDLVITVDTSIAHLAGAMGKTTWLLLDKHNDWRWGVKGDKNMWYPSIRLFRQKELFLWEPLFEDIVKELVAFQIQLQDQKKFLSCDKKDSLKRRSRKHSP